ncbi:PRD domain-containing protein [Kocuria palustris]|uniref:PRD domain-containing protein n=1 Tax=Kocuria palustris TaxID=71999 RepID=UPI0011AADEB8|nr:PRD domain-containing protein [Kocuria palustris]
MEILRVFNNNVVLARRDDGTEAVLTGRGLGFQAKPGGAVDESRIARTFVPVDGRDPDHMGEQLAAVSPERVQQAEAALGEAGLGALASRSPWLLIALADHLEFAIRRQRESIPLQYPLEEEVSQLYPEEFAQAGIVLAAFDRAAGVELPEAERVAIALHLVNAGFSTGDLSQTYTMTGLIQQVLDVIGRTYDRPLQRSSLGVARFITHLRYLFVRVSSGRQLQGERSSIGEAIRTTYTEAHRCALRVAALLELRLDSRISDDEVAYLALHIARVTTDPRVQAP